MDCNATTPVAGFLKPLINEWLEHWGNPSSIHWHGRGPKALLREARQNVARLIGCDPLEVIFTSGGSEANNLAIKGVVDSLLESQADNTQSPLKKMKEIGILISSAVEHPSVMEAMKFLQKKGLSLEVLPVSRQGHLDLKRYEELLSSRVALVSVMYANNETGNVFPIKKMAKMAKAHGALFHCDAVQALGKAQINVRDWGVDLASFSAHKFYALKGCGVLYVRKGLRLTSLIHGGSQERKRRAGTENLLAIASLGAMSSQAEKISEKRLYMQELRDFLQDSLKQKISGLEVTGEEAPRLPNTLSVVIPGVDGETLLMNLDMKGFSVSTGAACSSGSPEPSPVLLAMGLTREEAQSSLRVSLGWSTTREQVESFIEELCLVVERLRAFAPQALAR